MPPAATEIAHIPTNYKGGEIHIASLNYKNLKTSAYIIEELLKQHQIILIQEHCLPVFLHYLSFSVCNIVEYLLLTQMYHMRGFIFSDCL
jgi:hypothetical protein